jgi:metal-responsive CopG/Arc/MetJ family transcriptional regulator
MYDVNPIRVSVHMEPALLAMIEDHRRELHDIPSRAETIRRLCEQALAQTTSTRKRGKVPRKTAR